MNVQMIFAHVIKHGYASDRSADEDAVCLWGLLQGNDRKKRCDHLIIAHTAFCKDCYNEGLCKEQQNESASVLYSGHAHLACRIMYIHSADHATTTSGTSAK